MDYAKLANCVKKLPGSKFQTIKRNQAESAFDFKYIDGPGSSLKVEQVIDAQNETADLANKMYILTENLQCLENLGDNDDNIGDQGTEFD